MDHEPRKPRRDAVIEGATTPARRAPVDRRPVSRPSKKDEVALETYEQAPRRGSGDDARSELSRQPDNMEQPVRNERTARDEP
jgi:hypothetical protein